MRNTNFNANRRNDRPHGGNNGGNFPQGDRPSRSDIFWSNLNPAYNCEWITNEATPNLVDFAEKVGEFMANNGLTNSKIRNVYGEIKRIQMGEFEKEKSSFYLLKPKVAYALGRDEKNEGLKLFKKIFDKCFEYVTDQKSYLNFCNLMEAILAYHKAYGGKD
jgi:CRISPR-associated protein Csm2